MHDLQSQQDTKKLIRQKIVAVYSRNGEEDGMERFEWERAAVDANYQILCMVESKPLPPVVWLTLGLICGAVIEVLARWAR